MRHTNKWYLCDDNGTFSVKFKHVQKDSMENGYCLIYSNDNDKETVIKVIDDLINNIQNDTTNDSGLIDESLN